MRGSFFPMLSRGKGEGGSVSPGYERNAAIIIGPIGHLIGVFVSGTTATAVLRERSP